MGRDALYGYIGEHGPMFIGEFGTDKRDTHWNWTIRLMQERDWDFAYWSIDGDHFPLEATQFDEHVRGMEVDESFGLLNADYTSIRHWWKLQDLQSLMLQNMSSLQAR